MQGRHESGGAALAKSLGSSSLRPVVDLQERVGPSNAFDLVQLPGDEGDDVVEAVTFDVHSEIVLTGESISRLDATATSVRTQTNFVFDPLGLAARRFDQNQRPYFCHLIDPPDQTSVQAAPLAAC